jgi:hypothetical protein
MSSDLTRKFIANTYQKLLQVDNALGATGSDVTFDQTELVQSSKYSLLNGLGNKISAIAVESGSTGSGIFLKNTTIDPDGAWGISTLQADPFNGNVEVGLSFWRPSPSNNPNLHKLFLKNTGTTWIGYEGLSGSAPGTGIVTDVATYSLYVKDGVQVGQNTTGNNGRINLIGANPLENGAGMFINNQHPFLIYRFSHGNVGTNETTKRLKINGQDVSVTDWSAMVVGIQINHTGSQIYRQIDDWRCICVDDNGFWAVNLKYDLDGGDTQEFPRIDILFIKKGLYNDFRNSIVNIT